MIVGDRLRVIREEKQLSQGDIERSCGLKRCYISRVENGHTVPSIETMEKWSRSLGVPLHHIFYDGDQPPALPAVERTEQWGAKGKDARLLTQFRRLFAKMDESQRQLLLHMGRKLERENRSNSGRRVHQSR